MDTLKKECNRIVDLKYQIDHRIQKLVENNKRNCPSFLPSARPNNYLYYVLPFVLLEGEGGRQNKEVDPFSVIGGTYNDYTSKVV